MDSNTGRFSKSHTDTQVNSIYLRWDLNGNTAISKFNLCLGKRLKWQVIPPNEAIDFAFTVNAPLSSSIFDVWTS